MFVCMIQVNEIRRNILQSPSFKLADTELNDYIKAMTTLLTDPSRLATDALAMQAVVRLQRVIHYVDKSYSNKLYFSMQHIVMNISKIYLRQLCVSYYCLLTHAKELSSMACHYTKCHSDVYYTMTFTLLTTSIWHMY